MASGGRLDVTSKAFFVSLGASVIAPMSPVLQKCEPSASFREDMQKSEPFGGHAQKSEPFRYLGRACAAMPKLRTLSPKIAPKVHPPTIDQKNAFLHQTLIKNCDRKKQLNFLSFGMMSPVFQKCEPFASFCKDRQKSEPFGGHAQKCEPFAWACNPSLPVTAKSPKPLIAPRCTSPPVTRKCKPFCVLASVRAAI